MTNERVKTLAAKELDHFFYTEINVYEKMQERRTRAQTGINFQLRRIVPNEKKRRAVIE